ncbi:MAG: riboflavin biosynthesis protein RibF [Chloroflexi bacterium GWB2_49_20]|nr:MAG: riboflavin biosynthesis protein RibF [Chloroflexi bacterium GWB2_49_20]OGN77141.1 MAG: riboflavin biosynthesis protein RibF [Chloroflexi bacterium GWC2_49_37]OGN83867.1 MAG: riboflavin biosynthesis protein RibF [Chloroflexi bacterium GWD2_49_16]
MTQVNFLNDLSLQNTWLAIGVFDGVHRGHQQMLHLLTTDAHAESAPAVVLTFEPHPAVVLGQQTNFKWLSPPDERTALLKAQGVDHIILQHFDRDFASISARDFMESLSRQLGIRHLLVGYDFALGRDREGDVPFLTVLGKRLGYTLQPVTPVSDQNGVISSTRIRQHIRSGEVVEASVELGRLYAVNGEVVHGDGRGRTIHIPTANLDLPADKLIPTNGVYACWAWVAGVRRPAVTNIGTRPTFTTGEQALHVETHLLDHQEDIYGQKLSLEFAGRLRAEQRFPSVEALVGQIHKDIKQARKILA